MSREERWCKSANDIVVDAWRYARRLGRTAAERVAVFNVEMERLERHGASPLRARAKDRGLSPKAPSPPRSGHGIWP